MTDYHDIYDQFKIKELELNALLEITQSINENLSEESLYKIYEFTLRGNLRVQKMMLFVNEENWVCRASLGMKSSDKTKNFQKSWLKNTSYLSLNKTHGEFSMFDFMIPVYHKSSALAVVFIKRKENIIDENIKKNSIKFIQALSNIMMVAIENKKLAMQKMEQEFFRRELGIAREVQRFLFPKKLPYNSDIKIAASYLPHNLLGGDYYDYIPINEKEFLICIADVSGKGMPAALMMSNFQAALHTIIRHIHDLPEIIKELNLHVLKNSKGERYITSFIAIYNKYTNKMTYINSGHVPPILMSKSELSLLSRGSTVLGYMEELPFINIGEIEGLKDFLLFCYTDGLTETSDVQDSEYGQERLIAYLTNNSNRDLKKIHQDIIVEIDQFKETNDYQDDITMLSLKIT